MRRGIMSSGFQHIRSKLILLGQWKIIVPYVQGRCGYLKKKECILYLNVQLLGRIATV